MEDPLTKETEWLNQCRARLVEAETRSDNAESDYRAARSQLGSARRSYVAAAKKVREVAGPTPWQRFLWWAFQ